MAHPFFQGATIPGSNPLVFVVAFVTVYLLDPGHFGCKFHIFNPHVALAIELEGGMPSSVLKIIQQQLLSKKIN